MRVVVHFLSAEIPDVDFQAAAVGQFDGPGFDAHAVGGVFAGVEFVTGEDFGKRGLPYPAVAHKNEFGFVDAADGALFFELLDAGAGGFAVFSKDGFGLVFFVRSDRGGDGGVRFGGFPEFGFGGFENDSVPSSSV